MRTVLDINSCGLTQARITANLTRIDTPQQTTHQKQTTLHTMTQYDDKRHDLPMSAVPLGDELSPVKTTDGQAVASLVFGILGLLIFGVVLGPIAIVLGVSAKRTIREHQQDGIGGDCQATAGIILGCVAAIEWIVVLIYIAKANN